MPNVEAEPIIEAMRKTEETLLLRQIEKYYFRFCGEEDGRFWFQVPGNACDLGTSSNGMSMFTDEIGKTLYPHNVDTRFQQIEFIVGLSVLGDLFEKYLEQKKEEKVLL